jgi:GxxExxY protein
VEHKCRSKISPNCVSLYARPHTRSIFTMVTATLEKVYENALAHRLDKAGLHVKQQHPITVFDEDGAIIGEYFADLIVEGILIAELKACRALVNEHTAQILGYLRSARKEHGVLMNFGSYKFQVRKYVMSLEPPGV